MKSFPNILLLAFLTSSLFAQQTQLWLEGEVSSETIIEDGFEDMTLMPFTTSGHMPWIVNQDDASEGLFSAISGQTTLLEGSSIHLNVEIPAFTSAVLTFDAKSNVSGGFNLLLIDDVEIFSFDPIGLWESFEVELGPGNHDIEWRHGAIGSATLRLDNVRIVTKAHGIVRIQDGNEGAGKILVSDEFGNARWQNNIQIGDLAHGGIVFWVDESGEHGLVCSQSDLESPSGNFFHLWGADTVTGATGGTLADGSFGGKGAGAMNTMLIVSADRVDNDSAARLCADLIEAGYGDWYLPSKGELNLMRTNLYPGGGFMPMDYWSSSEFNDNTAWEQNFGSGDQDNEIKNLANRVRAIRAF